MTKKKSVGWENYNSIRMLNIRKNFHKKYVKPLIDIDKEIIQSLEFKGKRDVLDVGCGYGDLLSSIKTHTRGCRLTGVDISEALIDNAKKNRKGIKFAVADAQKLPFKKNYFDIVICKHVLCHVTDIKKAMREIHRVLKKGGILVIAQNTLTNSSRMHAERYRKYISQELNRRYLDTNHRFNLENYQKYVDGFIILREEKLFGYFISKNPGPMIDYINSMKDFYIPIPKDKDWKSVIHKLRMLIKREMRHSRMFVEAVGTGLIVLQKT